MQTRVGVALQPAVMKAAELIMATQRRYVPVDDGDLRDSIKAEFAERTPTDTRVNIMAGGHEAPHARIIEFGSRRQPAQPFFYPGYRVERKRAKALIAREIRKAIRSAV